MSDADPALEHVRAAVATAAKMHGIAVDPLTVSRDSNFAQLGFTDLGAALVVIAAEEAIGIGLPDEYDFRTAGELARAIDAVMTAGVR